MHTYTHVHAYTCTHRGFATNRKPLAWALPKLKMSTSQTLTCHTDNFHAQCVKKLNSILFGFVLRVTYYMSIIHPHCHQVLRALYVGTYHLWPRFQTTVQACLEPERTRVNVRTSLYSHPLAVLNFTRKCTKRWTSVCTCTHKYPF